MNLSFVNQTYLVFYIHYYQKMNIGKGIQKFNILIKFATFRNHVLVLINQKQ